MYMLTTVSTKRYRRAVFAKSTEWLVGVVLIALLMGSCLPPGAMFGSFTSYRATLSSAL